MDVPQEILKRWKALRNHGDPKDIVESMPEDQRVDKETIRRVYKQGKCNSEVFKAMADFYVKKAALIEQYL